MKNLKLSPQAIWENLWDASAFEVSIKYPDFNDTNSLFAKSLEAFVNSVALDFNHPLNGNPNLPMIAADIVAKSLRENRPMYFRRA